MKAIYSDSADDAPEKPCCHHWMIEWSGDGTDAPCHTVCGYCMKCGEVKEFTNIFVRSGVPTGG